MPHQLKIAELDKEHVEKIIALEQATGKHIMAFEDGPQFATLTAEQLAEVQALEDQLGVILIVYEDVRS